MKAAVANPLLRLWREYRLWSKHNACSMMLSAWGNILTVTVVVPVLVVKVRRGWLDEVVGEVVRRSW